MEHIFTPGRVQAEFEWSADGPYRILENYLVASGASHRVYRPAEVDDLPGKLISVLQGDEAVKRFALDYGFLGQATESASPRDLALPCEEESGSTSSIDPDEPPGEAIAWIRANAMNILAVRYAHYLLSSIEKNRLNTWLDFARSHRDEFVVFRGVLMTLDDFLMFSLPQQVVDSSPSGENGLAEYRARTAAGLLLQSGLNGVNRLSCTLGADGRPEMRFQFSSLVGYIYWKQYEQMAQGYTRICPCGELFQTLNRHKKHHDNACTNRMGVRRHRSKKNSRDDGGAV